MGNDFFVRAEARREEVIAITGIEEVGVMRIIFEGGLVKRSGMRFLSPFIYWTVKSYRINQFLSLRSCLSGSDLFLKFKIFGKHKLSNFTRKLCPIK